MNVKDHMPQAYARRLAQKVSALLKKRYGAKRVLLIGALTLGCYNPDFSEIDVLFEGVKDSDVAEAIDDCRQHLRPAGFQRDQASGLSGRPECPRPAPAASSPTRPRRFRPHEAQGADHGENNHQPLEDGLVGFTEQASDR